MKYLYTLIIIATTSFVAIGQSGTEFYFFHEDTSVSFFHGNDNLTIIEHIYMQNDDTDTTEVAWTVNWDIPAAWSLSICDEALCFPLNGNNTASSPQNTFLPGNGYMYDWHLWVNHDQIPGTGSADIIIKSQVDIFYTQTLTVNIEVTNVLGIKDQYAMNVAYVYPNPVNGTLKMNTEQNADLDKMILTNSLGQTVITKAIDKNSIVQEMDVQNYSKGIYNLTVIKENGTIFSSQMIEIE